MLVLNFKQCTKSCFKIEAHHIFGQVGGGEDETHDRAVGGGICLCCAFQGGQDLARSQEGWRDPLRGQRRHEQNSMDLI